MLCGTEHGAEVEGDLLESRYPGQRCGLRRPKQGKQGGLSVVRNARALDDNSNPCLREHVFSHCCLSSLLVAPGAVGHNGVLELLEYETWPAHSQIQPRAAPIESTDQGNTADPHDYCTVLW